MKAVILIRRLIITFEVGELPYKNDIVAEASAVFHMTRLEGVAKKASD